MIYFVHCALSLMILFYICACCDTRYFKKKCCLFLFVEVLLCLCYMLYNIRRKNNSSYLHKETPSEAEKRSRFHQFLLIGWLEESVKGWNLFNFYRCKNNPLTAKIGFLVSWARCGTWLYRFLIFVPLLTFKIEKLWCWPKCEALGGQFSRIRYRHN